MTFDNTTSSTIKVADPETGEAVGEVARMDAAAASSAFDRAYACRAEARNWPLNERARVLEDTAAIIQENAEEFARLIAREGVKTIREARGEVARTINTLGLSAAAARGLSGQTIPFASHPGGTHRHGWWTPEPIGLVVAITPFNDPLNLVAHKLGPAIAAGCPVVLKPHEATPLSAIALFYAMTKAGLPKGFVEIVTGYGAQVGRVLTTDPRAAMISFTGGLKTGQGIAAGSGLTQLSMELGSNCATIVMEDADLDAAAAACVSGMIAAAGQNCLHVQRVIAHAAIADALRDRLVAGLEAVRLGPKLDEATDMGCLIDQAATKRVTGLIEGAVSNGARRLCGTDLTGTRMAPVLLDRVPPNAALRKDEAFGPVTALIEADTFDAAISIANETQFGLQAAIFTSDLDRAHRAVAHLDAGAVIVNDSTDYRLDAMPFGGTRNSGIGREGVACAVRAMTEPKVACFTMNSARNTP